MQPQKGGRQKHPNGGDWHWVLRNGQKKRNQCENLIAGLFANSQETDQQRQLCNQYSISSMGIFSLF